MTLDHITDDMLTEIAKPLYDDFGVSVSDISREAEANEHDIVEPINKVNINLSGDRFSHIEVVHESSSPWCNAEWLYIYLHGKNILAGYTSFYGKKTLFDNSEEFNRVKVIDSIARRDVSEFVYGACDMMSKVSKAILSGRLFIGLAIDPESRPFPEF